jgi:hypothetical protein
VNVFVNSINNEPLMAEHVNEADNVPKKHSKLIKLYGVNRYLYCKKHNIKEEEK